MEQRVTEHAEKVTTPFIQKECGKQQTIDWLF